MEFYDTKQLRKTPRSGSNFDLFEVRYKFPADFFLRDVSTYRVNKGEALRMDLVSLSIYGSIEFVDFICFINSISNPLNIKEGQSIIYVDKSQIDDFKVTPPEQQITQTTGRPNRGNRPDPSRQEFLDNNLSLPPNLLEDPVEQVQLRDGIIRLGTG
jgi:hypothetical protein